MCYEVLNNSAVSCLACDCELWAVCSVEFSDFMILVTGFDMFVIVAIFTDLLQVEAYHSSIYTSEPDFNILQYWQSRSEMWPRLSEVAQGLLGVPASSTSSERTFSLAGLTLEDRRSQLSEESVDGLLFLHGLRETK
jgi:hypothetical protein